MLGLPDAQWGEKLVAVVVFKHQNATNPSSNGQETLSNWEFVLSEFLGGRIARYKLPRRWVCVDALPRTALGKVQKAVLARQLGPDAAA